MRAKRHPGTQQQRRPGHPRLDAYPRGPL